METKKLLNLGSRRLIGAAREEVYLKFNYDFTKPETIRGIVNQRCNFKCPYCYCWQRTEYPEMSIEQWQFALLSIKDYIGSYAIQFSGGEPFLKKGFGDLLKFCHANNIDWGVITNGSLFNQKTIDSIVNAVPLNVDISLDTQDTGVNDYVRGAKNSVVLIENGISKLLDARAKTNTKFTVRLKPTVTGKNYRGLPDLAVWAKDRGLDTVDFSPVRPEPFWNNETYSNLWMNLSSIPELEIIVETLISMKSEGYPIETSNEKLWSFKDHFSHKQVSHGAAPCRVGLRDYHINPTGEVNVCWEYPPIGNAAKQAAKEIWECAEAKKIRDVTINCEKFKTLACANSCLSHRTLKQEFERVVHFL